MKKAPALAHGAETRRETSTNTCAGIRMSESSIGGPAMGTPTTYGLWLR